MQNLNGFLLRIAGLLIILSCVQAAMHAAELTTEELVHRVLARRAALPEKGSGSYVDIIFIQRSEQYEKLRSCILQDEPTSLRQKIERWTKSKENDMIQSRVSAEKATFYYKLSKWRVIREPIEEFGQVQGQLEELAEGNSRAKVARRADTEKQAAFDGEFVTAVEDGQVLYLLPAEQRKYFLLSNIDPTMLPWKQVLNEKSLRPEQTLSASSQGQLVVLNLVDSASRDEGTLRVEHVFDPRLGYALVSMTLLQGGTIVHEVLSRYPSDSGEGISRPFLVCSTKRTKKAKEFQVELSLIEWGSLVDDADLVVKLPQGEYSILDKRFGGERLSMSTGTPMPDAEEASSSNWTRLVTALTVALIVVCLTVLIVRWRMTKKV